MRCCASSDSGAMVSRSSCTCRGTSNRRGGGRNPRRCAARARPQPALPELLPAPAPPPALVVDATPEPPPYGSEAVDRVVVAVEVAVGLEGVLDAEAPDPEVVPAHALAPVAAVAAVVAVVAPLGAPAVVVAVLAPPDVAVCAADPHVVEVAVDDVVDAWAPGRVDAVAALVP